MKTAIMALISHLMVGRQVEFRIYTFRDMVALSFPDTRQLYLSPRMARALARQLKTYADDVEGGNALMTRNVMEVTSHKRPIIVDDLTADSIRES